MINIIDSSKFKGEYKFEGFDLNGKKVFDKTYKNVLVQNYFNEIFAMLNGDAVALELTHIATGDGVTAPLKANVALENELFRKAISSKSITATQFILKLSIAASESVFTIKEIGVFAEATDTPLSGILISRCAVDVVKNASTQYLVTYTITAV